MKRKGLVAAASGAAALSLIAYLYKHFKEKKEEAESSGVHTLATIDFSSLTYEWIKETYFSKPDFVFSPIFLADSISRAWQYLCDTHSQGGYTLTAGLFKELEGLDDMFASFILDFLYFSEHDLQSPDWLKGMVESCMCDSGVLFNNMYDAPHSFRYDSSPKKQPFDNELTNYTSLTWDYYRSDTRCILWSSASFQLQDFMSADSIEFSDKHVEGLIRVVPGDDFSWDKKIARIPCRDGHYSLYFILSDTCGFEQPDIIKDHPYNSVAVMIPKFSLSSAGSFDDIDPHMFGKGSTVLFQSCNLAIGAADDNALVAGRDYDYVMCYDRPFTVLLYDKFSHALLLHARVNTIDS